MLVSPYLSPKSRAICSDHDTAYLDLVGNARLAFGSVYIERAVAEKPISETRALRSFFGTSENAVKTQTWIAVAVYVLVAIIKKRPRLDASLYTIPQTLSLALFEKNRAISATYAGGHPSAPETGR